MLACHSTLPRLLQQPWLWPEEVEKSEGGCITLGDVKPCMGCRLPPPEEDTVMGQQILGALLAGTSACITWPLYGVCV